jgi:hypothetical protein
MKAVHAVLLVVSAFAVNAYAADPTDDAPPATISTAAAPVSPGVTASSYTAPMAAPAPMSRTRKEVEQELIDSQKDGEAARMQELYHGN